MYCKYYQAKTDVKRMWFVVGCFRNEDSVAFVRAPEGYSDMLEFFVPEGQVEQFLHTIDYLKQEGYLLTFKQCKNRIEHNISVEQAALE